MNFKDLQSRTKEITINEKKRNIIQQNRYNFKKIYEKEIIRIKYSNDKMKSSVEYKSKYKFWNQPYTTAKVVYIVHKNSITLVLDF